MVPFLRPLVRRRTYRAIGGADRPMPDGPPVVRVAGPDPDRVLVLGSGPVSGAGVRSHDDALPGAVARALAARTRHGAWVEAQGRRQVRLAEMGELVRAAQLHRFDALVLVVGMFDAVDGVGARAWAKRLHLLLDELQSEGARDAVVLLTHIPPFSSVARSRGPAVALADRGVVRLNAQLDLMAQARPATVCTALPAPGGATPLATAAWYDRCGEAFAEILAPMLTSRRGG